MKKGKHLLDRIKVLRYKGKRGWDGIAQMAADLAAYDAAILQK